MAADEAQTLERWQAAEKLVRAHLTLRRGAGVASIARPRPRVPYLFRAELDDGRSETLLAHGGTILVGRGVGALGTYLRAIELLERRELIATDLLSLLAYFRAFPEIDEAAEGYAAGSEGPVLTYARKKALLALTYPTSGRWQLRVTNHYACEWLPPKG